jgi:hypothetical protein
MEAGPGGSLYHVSFINYILGMLLVEPEDEGVHWILVCADDTTFPGELLCCLPAGYNIVVGKYNNTGMDEYIEQTKAAVKTASSAFPVHFHGVDYYIHKGLKLTTVPDSVESVETVTDAQHEDEDGDGDGSPAQKAKDKGKAKAKAKEAKTKAGGRGGGRGKKSREDLEVEGVGDSEDSDKYHPSAQCKVTGIHALQKRMRLGSGLGKKK